MNALVEPWTLAGGDALRLFWWPIALWTVAAALVTALLRFLPARFAREQYELRTALLVSLPLGIVGAWIFRLLEAPALVTVPLPYEVVVYAGGGFETTGGIAPLPSVPFGALLLAAGAAALALVGLFRIGADARALARLDRSVRPVSDPVALSLLDEARDRFALRRPVRLVASPDVAVPAAYGLRRPTILVPDDMLARPDDLRLVLLHETSHLASGDFVFDAAARVVRGLFGWHPLVAQLGRSHAWWREAACDLAVLDTPSIDRARYARVLLETAVHRTHEGLVASMGSPRSLLTRRIETMTRIQHPAMTLPFVRHVAVLLVFAVAITFTACSDSTPAAAPPTDESAPRASEAPAETFLTPDQMPAPQGGMEAIAAAIRYPDAAKAAGIQGKVVVSFVVNPDGTVRDVTVAKGIDAELDAEAVRVVSESAWTPGTLDGNPIASQLSLPISFRLQ